MKLSVSASEKAIVSSGGNWSPPSGSGRGAEPPPGPFIGLATPKLGRPPARAAISSAPSKSTHCAQILTGEAMPLGLVNKAETLTIA